MRTPLAVLGSDIHLREKTPLRRTEKDWNAVQFGYLEQVRKLCNELDVPFVIAGDLFHLCKTGPSVVNEAIRFFRGFHCGVYAIPGQHDLPYHRLDMINQSSFWTLVQADSIHYLAPNKPVTITSGNRYNVMFYGFPWGTKITPVSKNRVVYQIAVVHKYIWHTPESGHARAEAASNVSKMPGAIGTYDAAAFGDNHHGFVYNNVINCGTLIRQKSDELRLWPHVGIFYSDGTLESHRLDCSGDKWELEDKKAAAKTPEQEEFAEVMHEAEEIILDFASVMKQRMADLIGENRTPRTKRVAKIVYEAMEDGEGP